MESWRHRFKRRRAGGFALAAGVLATALLVAAPSGAQSTRSPALHFKPSPAVLQGARGDLPAAQLHFHSQGDIPDRGSRKYLPTGSHSALELESNLGREPRIQRVLWQVSRHPFYGATENPVGLVASGYASQRVFEIPASAFRTSGPAQLSRDTRLPRALGRDPPGKARIDIAAAQAVANAGIRWSPPAPHFYVRILPVDHHPSLDPQHRPDIIGKPSATLEVIRDEPPTPQTDMIGFDVVSRQDMDIRLLAFRYQPEVVVEMWPAGCTPIPRDEGKDAIDVLGDAPGALVDLVNWASEAYNDLKKMAVSLVGTLLPFVPESVIAIALDGALAAAGFPPSIPNMDQLMNGGADYLATQVAAQIPVPASGVLAEMAAEEAREEIRSRTKQALLETAKQLAERERNTTRWCRRYVADPYFEITLRNAGPSKVQDATLFLGNSGDLLESSTVGIQTMDPGQTFTIPIAYRQNKNVPHRWVSQLPEHDKRQALKDWWMAYQNTPVSFTVAVTESVECRGDGTCDQTRRELLTTPTRLWDHAPVYRSNGR